MISPTRYQLTCDTPGCVAGMVDQDSFRLSGSARSSGWMLRRRLDGTIAKKGGKDYCPTHVPDWWRTGEDTTP